MSAAPETPANEPRSERVFGDFPRWLIVLVLVTVGSTALPYAYQALTTPEGEFFPGTTLPNIYDHNTYFAWTHQVRDGKILVHNLNAVEEHPPMLPNLPWLVMGLTARFTGIPSVYLYHAIRIVLGVIYLLLVYAIAREVGNGRGLEARATCHDGNASDAHLKIAMVIVTLGTGLGFFALLLDHDFPPAELWIPEMWAYSTIMSQPHFVLALVGVALTVLGVLVGLRRRGWQVAAMAFGGSMLMTHVHPFTAAVVLSTLVLFLPIVITRGLRWAPIIWAGAGAVPPLGLLGYYYMTNEFARKWAANSILVTPPLHETLLGLGLVLPLALWGAWIVIRKDESRASMLLMVIWMLVTLIALYGAPISFQRRCFEGLHLPMALLAAWALADYALPALNRQDKSRSEATERIIVMLLVLFLPTHGLYVGQQLDPGNRIPPGWVAAYEWLHENTPEDACVVAPFRASSYGTRYAVRRFYFSHTFETPDWQRKQEIVEAFFDEDAPLDEREKLLGDIPCEYLMFADEPSQETVRALGLARVFSAHETWVYGREE